jgi:hypothetical protein
MPEATHPNIALLSQLDLHNLDACANIFADDFVWHYFNPKLPELLNKTKRRQIRDLIPMLKCQTLKSINRKKLP